jgi:hypothetical protein
MTRFIERDAVYFGKRLLLFYHHIQCHNILWKIFYVAKCEDLSDIKFSMHFDWNIS